MAFWNLFKKKIEDYEIEEDFYDYKNEYIDEDKDMEESSETLEEIEEYPIQLEDEPLVKENNYITEKLEPEEIDELITSQIIKVIEGEQSFDGLKSNSEDAVKVLGDEYIDLLPAYLSSKVSRPRHLREKYDALGEWQMVVQNAVLIILFSYKEKGVRPLVKILYSNTNLRMKCINLLCKLAADGIRTEDIINTIMNNLPYFRDDEKIKIFGFMSQIKGNNQVIALIQYFYKKFVKSGEIVKGYETLCYLINVAGRYTKGHLNFLKAVALGKTLINLEEVMGIDEEDEKIIQIDEVEEAYRVKAAITYHSLEKEDEDINSKLYYWSEYSLNKDVRRETKEVINSR